MQHLSCIVPLVHGSADIDAFIALQTDQRSVEDSGQNLGNLCLAHAWLTF